MLLIGDSKGIWPGKKAVPLNPTEMEEEDRR